MKSSGEREKCKVHNSKQVFTLTHPHLAPTNPTVHTVSLDHRSKLIWKIILGTDENFKKLPQQKKIKLTMTAPLHCKKSYQIFSNL